ARHHRGAPRRQPRDAVMTVHRETLLPAGPSAGHLIVTESVLAPTLHALRQTHAAGVPHEGLVLWLGRIVAQHTLVLAVATPEAMSGPQHVHLSEASVGQVARFARSYRLGVVAQVHSHPGGDTRHSDGDDQLVLMPYEGLFSLVVAHYGRG